ncbi:hypothetical protein [Mesorhizobium sp. B2-6-2]|uniref:hypothetical protein n=1 Tax=Mesorhizobium sp. B2-6-2 TaxID=2589915 RepID=UPI0011296DF1|nr:hypothetical protein [Mesorhizobium sp. B2-6-2]TPJ77202.1 hypothetical protein FJ419_16955 [Mesorhizobium sp. B2-6-2]
MTKLSDLGRRFEFTAHDQPGAPVTPDVYRCETCGQLVDRGDLRQVLWHEQPQHEPLQLDS